MKAPPKFVTAIIVVVLLGIIAVSAAFVAVREINQAEERRDCARAVASRDDARAMWLYLLGAADEDEDPERVETFAKKLNELLPPLRCENGNWVPDRGNADS